MKLGTYRQLCDDNNVQTSSLVTERADKVIPSLQDCTFSNVCCHLQVQTDVFGEKDLLQIRLFMCCSGAPAVLTDAQEMVVVGLRSNHQASLKCRR